MLFVIFILPNYGYWQMLLPICFYLSDVNPFFNQDFVFCDRCYVTVVMAFIVADVVPLW